MPTLATTVAFEKKSRDQQRHYGSLYEEHTCTKWHLNLSISCLDISVVNTNYNPYIHNTIMAKNWLSLYRNCRNYRLSLFNHFNTITCSIIAEWAQSSCLTQDSLLLECLPEPLQYASSHSTSLRVHPAHKHLIISRPLLLSPTPALHCKGRHWFSLSLFFLPFWKWFSRWIDKGGGDSVVKT